VQILGKWGLGSHTLTAVSIKVKFGRWTSHAKFHELKQRITLCSKQTKSQPNYMK